MFEQPDLTIDTPELLAGSTTYIHRTIQKEKLISRRGVFFLVAEGSFERTCEASMRSPFMLVIGFDQLMDWDWFDYETFSSGDVSSGDGGEKFIESRSWLVHYKHSPCILYRYVQPVAT